MGREDGGCDCAVGFIVGFVDGILDGTLEGKEVGTLEGWTEVP